MYSLTVGQHKKWSHITPITSKSVMIKGDQLFTMRFSAISLLQQNILCDIKDGK